MPADIFAIMSMQLQIPGILACLSSSLVILTYVIFEDLRKLRYIQLVFYMAVNDFIASAGVSVGYAKTGTPACWFQGLVTNANYVSSSFWTVVITYQLWLAVKTGKIIQDLTFIHIFCWGFPWVVALLPLTTSTYGDTDDLDSWCFIKNAPNSPGWSLNFWYWLSFYVWIFLSVIVMTVLLADVTRRVRSGATSNMVKSSLWRLMFYPIIILVCWIPSAICDFLTSGGDTNNHNQFLVNSIGNIFPVCQGTLAGIVFFTQNAIVRQKWAKLLCCSCCGWSSQSAIFWGLEFGAESDNDLARESDYISSAEQTFDLRTTFGTLPTITVRQSEQSLFSNRTPKRMSDMDQFAGEI